MKAYLAKLADHLSRLFAIGLVKYLAIGGTTFVIDFGGLVLMHGVLGINLIIATTLSYWLAVMFNFTANRHWTFRAKEKANLARHATLYGMLLACNYAFTIGFLYFFTHVLHVNYAIAKVVAVGLQITWTYPLYKHVIFVTPTTTTTSQKP